SVVSIKSSSFVETRQGPADRGGAARPASQRRKAGVDDRRLHCRDAADRHAASHTRSRRPRWRWWWWRGTWRRWAGAWAAVAVGVVGADTSQALADMAAGLAGTAAE